MVDQSKEFPNPTCPICGSLETAVDHAVTTSCTFAKSALRKVQLHWWIWTSNDLLDVDWNMDWIPKNTPYRDQLDMVMTTAKRIVWHNYTESVFKQSSIDLDGFVAKWMVAVKRKVKAFTWMCNNRRMGPQWKMGSKGQ